MNTSLYPATDALDIARSLLTVASDACNVGGMSDEQAEALAAAAERLAAQLADWRAQRPEALPERVNMAINWTLIDLDAVAQFSQLFARANPTDLLATRLLMLAKHAAGRAAQNLMTSGARITLTPVWQDTDAASEGFEHSA